MNTTRMARAFALVFLVTATALHAQVPNLINYQGRVAVGTPPVNFDGTGQFRFALVNAAGTTTYWSNSPDTTPADGVPDSDVSLAVSKGLYSVLLGDTAIPGMAAIPASVWSNADVRLRVWFNDAANGIQLVSPDQRLAPNGYLPEGAVSSAAVASGAITSTKIAAGAVTNTQLAADAVQAGNILAGSVNSTKIENLAVTAAKLGGDVGLWSVNGGNVYRGGGNVGISTANPSARLEVESSDQTTTIFAHNTGGGAGNQPALRARVDALSGARNIIQAENGGGSVFLVRDDGNVGIGTATPEKRLHVVGDGKIDGSLRVEGNVEVNVNILMAQGRTLQMGHTALFTSATGVGLELRGTGFGEFIDFTNDLSNDYDVRLGLGDDDAIDVNGGGLRIYGSINTNLGVLGAYISGSGGSLTPVGHGVHPVSIYTTGTIWSSNAVIASSDARIKCVEGRSDGVADLSTLLGLEVTNYRYKDVVSKGNAPQKKLIAQQVEKVFSQAVSYQTDVVPDIYKKAACKNGWIELASDLKKGDRVRLIAAKSEGIYEVLETDPERKRFRTAFAPEGSEVFVYGREVKDFRVVEYDAVAMLNVSATQELARKVATKDAEIATLKASNVALAEKLAALEARDKDREARLTRLEKALDERPIRAVRASFDPTLAAPVPTKGAAR